MNLSLTEIKKSRIRMHDINHMTKSCIANSLVQRTEVKRKLERKDKSRFLDIHRIAFSITI